jgi:hypothetical protein
MYFGFYEGILEPFYFFILVLIPLFNGFIIWLSFDSKQVKVLFSMLICLVTSYFNFWIHYCLLFITPDVMFADGKIIYEDNVLFNIVHSSLTIAVCFGFTASLYFFYKITKKKRIITNGK